MTQTNSNPSSSTPVDLLDDINSVHHPLYFNPHDHPGMILISKKLSGSENYSTWKRSMMIALSARNKLKLPLPIVAKAYSMLRQEEKQREAPKQTTSSVPFALNTYRNTHESLGHTKEECYKLVGYPVGHPMYNKLPPQRRQFNSS
ncbi:cysteine-rich receptor-like protein kinase 8 [Tanacetum coccineum]